MTALSPNPRLLKNRNQPTVLTPVSPAPPASKAKSQTTQPPPKALDVSPFYNAPTALARAGVPVVAKADPATASTISSYSPAMGLKNDLPTQFTSPPLLPGLLKSLTEVIGGPKPPTRIQALSLKWVVEPWTMGQENLPTSDTEELAIAIPEPRGKDYKEFLLSSDPGSGKSIAYLLPVLQSLKLSEVRRSAEEATPIASKRGLNPRALILACTHELARQISTVAKSLLHDVKLRVLCASRANEPTRAARDQTVTGKGKKNSSASQMKALLSFADDGEMGEFQVKETDLGAGAFPVDIVVGTPMKLLEMVRGRGWERSVEFGGGVATATKTPDEDSSEADADSKERGPKLRRGRDSVPGVGKWRSSPEMGLSEVEWVIVDEADVLFDPDFQETTRMLLADISRARGHDVPFAPLPVGLLAAGPSTSAPVPTTSRQKEKEKKEKEKEAAQGKLVVKRGSSVITPLNYPFNFLLTSATIPHSLSSYLNAYHPRMLRLVTSSANHLPKTVKPEYVSWTGGNKNADIERRLRKVWAADAADGLGPVPDSLGDMSKVLIFCNKNTKVRDLGEFLNEKGIKNVQLSSSSPNRKRGNNKHLDGFLKTTAPDLNKRPDDWSSSWVADEADEGDAEITSEVVKKKEPKGSLLPVARKDPPTEKEPVNDPMHVPHVMITTSLLSRGLDFSPNVKHVFIVDDPRNMTDFLHRAGRTGRAGASGRVVIFGQMEGRGSQKSKEIRKKVKALMA
ncbi:P-loop containing nucleoside triphosphate hydrolase protein [Mycena latifolia]|nr:P-loop containing nucleoside triphosphate hydrolase protein [Mycena latifolia]